MKTMTCSMMGGPCDASMTAATPEEMANKGMDHLTKAHPDMAAKMKAMSKGETDKWMSDFKKKWSATPDA